MPDIVIRCPNCGSEETVDQNQEYFKCHHCFRTFHLRESKTVLDSTLRRRLDDAITRRNACDFEEAALILEDLVSNNPDVAEIYYQLLLTDYGVSFVSENDDITEKPVLSSVQEDSLFFKENYHKLEHLLSNYPNQLKNYRDRLEEIEKIREASIKAMKEIEPFDIFICYKRTTSEGNLTWDSKTADKLYRKFTEWGLNTFYAEETLYHKYAGKAFEPIICSALLSAKVFVLVCASPNHKEYLLAPWVKNEWTRFKKRMDKELDLNLRLLPVFDNGFLPEQLPKALMKGIEGIKLDDEFDKIAFSIVAPLLSREKKSKFNDIKVQTNKVGTLSVKKEEIVSRQFKGFKEKELSNLEKTDFTMAIADMKINSNSKYKAAYKKLTRLTETNKFNFEANLAKLKCNFKIAYDDSLVNANLWRVDDIPRMNNDFLALMEAGGEDCIRVRKAMIQMLLKAFANSPNKFANELKKEDNTFLTIAKTYEDKSEMFSFAKEFEKPYFDLINTKAQDGKAKIKDEDILTIANKLFRRIYSNYEESGAKDIFDLYRKSFIALSHNKNKSNNSLVDKFINLALQINRLDVDCLWYRFCFDINCLGADEYVLAKKIGKKNFIEFDVNKKSFDIKTKKANLYYFMIKAIESGYKMQFVGQSKLQNYFYTILRTACVMVNKKAKQALAIRIFVLLASLTGTGSTSDDNTIALLMAIGDRLLLEKKYKEARRYYEEVLNIDDANCEARWGLVKCDIKKPSNYSILFYRKSLNDVSSYRTLVAVHEEKHSDEVNHYLEFYEAIENIKNGKGKENSQLKKAFKNRNQDLMMYDLPHDNPVGEIINMIANGTLIQFATRPKRGSLKTKNSKVIKGSSSSNYSIVKERVQVAFNIILIALSIAAIILLKPESAFIVILVTSISAAFMARFGFGYLITKKNPFKPLLIVFGALSMIAFVAINAIIYSFYSMVYSDVSSVFEQKLFAMIVPPVYAFIDFISIIVKKTKPSSRDCDCSNVFTHHLLSIMAVAAAATCSMHINFIYAETSTIFGIQAELNSFMQGIVSYMVPVALPALTSIILKLIRGKGI